VLLPFQWVDESIEVDNIAILGLVLLGRPALLIGVRRSPHA
jgi:hypothetical protein